ncbi:MAG: MmgE/PrpD family protein [Chloroflexi bacterium]|nr:MmgE/PrpD family protein [Chloroflexota bacterium]
MEPTRTIASFIAGTRFTDLPADALESAKKAFMDCFGVAMAGSVEPAADIIRGLVQEEQARPAASVFGGNFMTTPMLAALANGTIAHALDYDDGAALPIPFHPSVPVLPVALALGESEKASGQEVLLAYVLGLEVETKVAAIVDPAHFAHGWHPTGTLGTLGATAAAAKLLKLSSEQCEISLGIASSLAGGVRQNFGTMTKPLHAGNAARNGITAATLARNGFTGAGGILEAPCGFLNVFMGKGKYSLEGLEASLGNPFHVVRPGIALKKYPCCRGTHPSIEAMEEVIRRERFGPQEVERIELSLSSVGQGDDNVSRPHARTSLEGKFSVEHCVSALLLDGEVTLRQFALERVLDPAVEAMRQRVKVHSKSDLLTEAERRGHMAAAVSVTLKNGRNFSYFYRASKEEMGIPWSWEDVEKKFAVCAGLALPADTVERMKESLRRLDQLPGVDGLMRTASAAG